MNPPAGCRRGAPQERRVPRRAPGWPLGRALHPHPGLSATVGGPCLHLLTNGLRHADDILIGIYTSQSEQHNSDKSELSGLETSFT